jgi:regulator of cell morphogenesis and NO signaling
MFELSSETRIMELEAESPAMMTALKATGIFRDGDDADLTIGELCFGFGLSPMIILNTLARVQPEVVPSNVDISGLESMTLVQVVEHIESMHHAYLRETLPVIGELVGRVVTAHGAGDERLVKLQTLIEKLATDLENHMLHEEEALFPMCRDMEVEGTVKLTRCGDAVGGPIACMENEHNIAKEELAQMRELTDNFAVPAGACGTYRALLEHLARFDQDMAAHIYKEDTVLFPRALQTQAALRDR